MSQSLLLILLATVPLAALGWCLGWLADRFLQEARARVMVWQLAILAPAVLVPAVLLAVGVQTLRPAPAASIAAPVMNVRPLDAPATAIAAPAPAPKPAPPYGALLLGLIGAGAVVQLSVRLARGFKSRQILRRSEPCDIPALEDILIRRARMAGVLAPALRLWSGGEPVLVGVRHPAILLPSRLARESGAQRIEHIFAHELAHLKARDHWRMPMLDLMTAAFWFNPMVAACALRLRTAQEEACDAVALMGADRQARRAYAETLVAALKTSAAPEPALAFTGWRRTPMVVRRLRAVLRPLPVSKPRAQAILGFSGLTLAAALAGSAAALAATVPAPTPVSPAPRPTAAPRAAGPSSVAPRPVAAARAVPRPATASPAALTPAQQKQLQDLSQQAAAARRIADEAGLRSLETALIQAQDNLSEAKQRLEQGLITRNDFNAAQTAVSRAQADMVELQARQADAARSRFLADAGIRTAAPAPVQSPTPDAVASAQRRTDQARIASGIARTAADRAERLYTDGLITQQSLETARRNAAEAERNSERLLAMAAPAPVIPPRPAPLVFTPSDIVQQPTQAQFLAAYPKRPLEAAMSGRVTLNCQATVTGAVVACSVASETPRGEGFGAAALRLVPFFKLRPKLQDGVPVPGPVTIPVNFVPS